MAGREDEVTVLVMRTAHYLSPTSIGTAGDIVETNEILAAVGSDFIVTVRHGAHTALAGVRAELEGSPEHIRMGPWAVLHAVIDRIVDGYLGVVGSVEVDIDALEVELLSPDRYTPVEQIYLVKREVLELRRSVNPLAAARSTLAAATSLPEPIPKDVHRHRVMSPNTTQLWRNGSSNSTMSSALSLLRLLLGSICSRTRICARSPRGRRWRRS
ncbi:hypothetical protein DBV08_00275 [Rhodococcus sp. KBW08]|nr:hypothetical protein DBV08_00275 [Rhodococcus sp. KBW08]